MVERMKAAGCIVIGKTNMPEFGLGSHTYNNLFGATGNAWDPSVSAGGSSGGAAVALAQRLLPVADGSDFMGSLRNPAAWNHVFGLRPSQGRVPYWPTADAWVAQLGTEGPMARTVRDLAKLLSIQAGHDPRAPLSIAQGPQDFVPAADASVRGARIAWLGDLGGHLALEPGIADGVRTRAADDGATPARWSSRCRRSASTSIVCGRPGWCGGACWWRRVSRRRSRCPAPRASRSSPKRCGSTTRRRR